MITTPPPVPRYVGPGDQVQPGALVRLAWPLTLRQGLVASATFLDALFVASHGVDAVLAVTVAAVNVECALVLPQGVLGLTQDFSSRLEASGRVAAARRYGWYGLLTGLVCGLVAILAIPLLTLALQQLTYPPDTRELIIAFVSIRLLGAGFVLANEALSAWFAGRHQPRRGMWAGLAGIAVHVAANLVLVDGAFGVPAMGVRGAAWAGVLGASTAFVLLVVPFVRTGGPRRLRTWEWNGFLRIGAPTGLAHLAELSAITVLVNVTFAGLPAAAVAALMVVMQIDELFLTATFGVAVAAGILTGHHLGRDRAERVPQVLGRALVLGFGLQAVVALGYLVGGSFLVDAFALPHDGADMLDIGVRLLLLSIGWHIPDVIVLATGHVLRAAGDTMAMMVLRVAAVWLVLVPVSHVLVARFEADGAVLGVAIYLAVTAALLVARFRYGPWERIGIHSTRSGVS